MCQVLNRWPHLSAQIDFCWQAMGVEPFIRPADIINANDKLLLAFCAQLFTNNANEGIPSVHKGKPVM